MKKHEAAKSAPLSPEVLRTAHRLMLKILKEVHRVCEENGIRYFLSDGTLIGAVRHNGFIPWDDDIDISMLRSDYDRFCKIAPEKLGAYYCLKKTIGLLLPLKFWIAKRTGLCVKYEALPSSFVFARYQVFARRGESEKDLNTADNFTSLVLHDFEGEQFYIPEKYDAVLRQYYGDYMTLPPPEKQRNHGIVEYDFGDYS